MFVARKVELKKDKGKGGRGIGFVARKVEKIKIKERVEGK